MQIASNLEVLQEKYKADLAASNEREKVLQVKLAEKVQAIQTASNDRAMYLSEKRSPVELLRNSVTAELAKAENLVSQRTQLYGEYSSHGRPAVRFDMATPLSSRGRSLDTLGKLLSNARDVPQCNLVQKEVREIVRRVNEDIALLRRLMR
jgi:hypothetical protein